MYLSKFVYPIVIIAGLSIGTQLWTLDYIPLAIIIMELLVLVQSITTISTPKCTGYLFYNY